MKKTQPTAEQLEDFKNELRHNEFLELTERLLDPYVEGKAHFEITASKKTEKGWALIIERIEMKNGGAENESNK